MVRFRKLILIWLVCSVTLFSPCSHAETLHIGLSEWAPWIIKNGDSISGIVVDICREAIHQAGHDSLIIEIPQKRRDLLEWGREIHVEPGCSRSWRRAFDDVSVYTRPYLVTLNVVVSPKGVFPPPNTRETFYGEVVGCNLGYYYTDGFSQAFDQGRIIRDDCVSGRNLVKKLLNSRNKAVILDAYEWKYWMTEMGAEISDFEESYRFSQPNNLRIRLHASKKYLIEPLNKALEAMQSDRTIENIVKQYMSSQTPALGVTEE